MNPANDLAARLLRFEQQLQAYQKLHGEELAELWKTFNEYKREFAAALPDERQTGERAWQTRAVDERQEENAKET